MVSCLPSFPPFNLHTPWSDSDIWLSYDQQDVRDKHLWAQERIPPRVNNGLITWPIRGNQKTPWNAHNRPRCHSNSMKRERKQGQYFLRTCGHSVNNVLLLTSFPSHGWNTLWDEGYFFSAKRNISHISETCSGRTLQKVPGGSEKKSEQPGRSSHCRVDRLHTIERTDSCLLMVDWPKYMSSWKDFKWNCSVFFESFSNLE